jgi:hypothetical protein
MSREHLILFRDTRATGAWNWSGNSVDNKDNSKPARSRVAFQIVALVLGWLAVAFGIFCVYGTAFPGPRGDNPGPALAVLEAWLVDGLVGLTTLVVGLLVKKGSPRLRRTCIVVSLVTLSLPPVVTFFFERWYHG